MRLFFFSKNILTTCLKFMSDSCSVFSEIIRSLFVVSTFSRFLCSVTMSLTLENTLSTAAVEIINDSCTFSSLTMLGNISPNVGFLLVNVLSILAGVHSCISSLKMSLSSFHWNSVSSTSRLNSSASWVTWWSPWNVVASGGTWLRFKADRCEMISEFWRRLSIWSFSSSRNLFFVSVRSASSTNSSFWKTSKQVLNLDKSSSSIPTLKMHNEFAETDQAKAEMLNLYFSSQTRVDDTNKDLPLLQPALHSLNSIEISIQDVKDVLLHLNVSKASGPDLISPHLLKEGADILAHPFSIVFNRSLNQGYFPHSWKEANVSSIFKKDDRSLPSNYRPISLLCQAGKVMERCIHKHLYNYVLSNHILTPLQSGFVSGDSTTFQLLHTYHMFCEAVDSGKEVRAVFCDISKAFDRVWHKALLHKLRGIGCSGKVLSWFSSYLSGRRQRVVLNGKFSKWVEVLAGVPQGSILGPLLFLIYINDIVKRIGGSIRLFADDTSLYIIVDLPEQAAMVLNADLQTISHWANDWLVLFNANKTLSMVISRKLNPVQHPPLFMNDTIIAETTSHKHLGLTFSSTCTWNEHVNNISLKASTRVNLLRALKFRVSRKSLEKLYISFIRPLLEYSDSVWDNCSSESKKQLEAIHTESARIVSGATKLCSIEKLFVELGWESLQSRRNKHKLILFYKILHGLTPDYLYDLVPPLVQDTTSYNLRNSDNIQNYTALSNLFLNSFFPSTIRAWNDLPNDTKMLLLWPLSNIDSTETLSHLLSITT